MRTFNALTALALVAAFPGAGCASQTSPAAAPVALAPVATPAVVASAPPPKPLVHVQVLAINDFHGNLEAPHGHDGTVHATGGEYVEAGGAAYLSARVQLLAQKNPSTVVVSAGDLTGASPLVSNLFQDEPTVLFMNHLGLEFEGVGNHDFDRGIEELTRLQRGGRATDLAVGPSAGPGHTFPGARFQYLAANVFGPDGKTVFPAYGIKELGGVKIAFVGMTLQGTRTVTKKESVVGLTFADEAKTANALIPELRAQGVATAVILLHQGGFQDEGATDDDCRGFKGDILPVLGALDPWYRVVVSAHTHQAYNCTIDGRIVTSASSYGRVVTDIDLTVDPSTSSLVDAHARNIVVAHDIAPDPDVVKLVAAYQDRASPMTARVVGYERGGFTRDPKAIHSGSCETPLGDLIADSQLAATRKAGAVIALMNPGGIRTDLAPEPTSAGPASSSAIPYAAAFEVQPFGNRLITVSLTGAELHSLLGRQFAGDRPRVLSVSKGFSYRYVYKRETKALELEASSMKLDGKGIDPTKRYRVTVNGFLAEGGDGFTVLRDAPERTEGVFDIDAFVTYLKGNSSAQAPLAPSHKLDRVSGNGCE
jgi:5'-nucleotidase